MHALLHVIFILHPSSFILLVRKNAGIFGLLVVVMAITAILDPKFLQPYNLMNIARWTGLYGILTIGAAFVIVTGGIDLSIGSVVGLTGVLLPMLLVPGELFEKGLPAWLGFALIIALSLAIGFIHGLLIAKLRIQPFIITLCGLFVYRGAARYIAQDITKGFGSEFRGLKRLADARLPGDWLPASWMSGGALPDWFRSYVLSIPAPFLMLLALALIAAVVLNKSVYGRRLLAIGSNEQAARYSGINTDRMIIVAYMICSGLAGFAGILFALNLNSVQPSGQGNFFELYAIAGAVLGGCSLRGGEGSILGVLIGTAIVRVLYNAINILGIATQLEFAVIGLVILSGVVADELVRRYVASRQRVQQGAQVAASRGDT
jgi:ribose transport system permease protein